MFNQLFFIYKFTKKLDILRIFVIISAYGGFMTKLKDETNKLTTAISELENELNKLNKNEIKADINLKSKLNNLLENLMENKDIQKNYPKYEKLKKL